MQKQMLLNRAIEAFYDGIVDAQRWHEALKYCGDLLETAFVALLARSQTAGHATINSAYGGTARAVYDYNTYYARLDPTLALLAQREPGCWYVDSRDFGLKGMADSVFYQEFMQSYRWAWLMAARLFSSAQYECYIMLQRSVGSAAFDDEALHWGSALMPHLQRATRLSCSFANTKLEGGMGWGVLDRVVAPLLVVDAKRSVYFINRAAELLLLTEPRLKIERGLLALLPSSIGQRFASLLQAACCYDAERDRPGVLRIRRAGGGYLQLVITPLAANSPWVMPGQPCLALLSLYDPQQPLLAGNTLLAELYGLSQAEIRLALLLFAGKTPTQCADILCVGMSTVRTQLRALFAKTETHRQAELVKLLANVLVLKN